LTPCARLQIAVSVPYLTVVRPSKQVMIVAGPNSRTDYHMEAGEEWFYQLEGGMTLKVDDGGDFYDIRIEEGDTFCLGPNIPHSPQRDPGSIGIVLERERKESTEGTPSCVFDVYASLTRAPAPLCR